MEGQALAREFNVPFVETSAKDDINIRKAVFTCIRLVDDTIVKFSSQNNASYIKALGSLHKFEEERQFDSGT